MCTQMLECHSVYRTNGAHGRRVGMWAFDSESRSPRIVFALKSLQNRLTDTLIQDALQMDLIDRMVLLDDSEQRGQLTEIYRNAKSMLEKAERLLKKPDLERCEMSTTDISTSIGGNRAEQDRLRGVRSRRYNPQSMDGSRNNVKLESRISRGQASGYSDHLPTWRK
jgi:hypothetical protein